MCKFKKKGDWKDDESGAQEKELINEFGEVGKGQVRLGFSGCERI